MARQTLLVAAWVLILKEKETDGFIVSNSQFLARDARASAETRMYGSIAGEWAKRLGRVVGETMYDSEWKRVPEEFKIGFEEGEIEARARNASPMELPGDEGPTETADSSAENHHDRGGTTNSTVP